MAVRERKLVQVTCDWCGKVLYDGPADNAPRISLHRIEYPAEFEGYTIKAGICDDCWDQFDDLVRRIKRASGG